MISHTLKPNAWPPYDYKVRRDKIYLKPNVRQPYDYKVRHDKPYPKNKRATTLSSQGKNKNKHATGIHLQGKEW